MRDLDNSYLALEPDDTGLEGVLGSSIPYRIAVGPRQGRKAFRLQSLLPAGSLEESNARVEKVADFSLHAGVAAVRHERQKLERLCRYITRPAIAEPRLSLTPSGNVSYQMKIIASIEDPVVIGTILAHVGETAPFREVARLPGPRAPSDSWV